MKTNKGLALDSRPEEQPEGTYPYGKNGLLSDITNAIVNEPGFSVILSSIIPAGYQINGILS